MSTYKEITYQILDELKIVSDDSHFVEEHILFLMDKMRCFLLKQRYSDIRKEVPESNYQTVCIDLTHVTDINGIPCTNISYLKSIEEIPHMMNIGSLRVTTLDYFQGNINYTNSERFKYVGHNKYLKNQAYATIAPDNHLYIKSDNPQLYYLEKVKVTGILENSLNALALNCANEDSQSCDLLDERFPLEEALIPSLIELIVKELSAAKYQAKDDTNNANDDLSDLANYIRNQIAKGKYSDLYKNHS